MKAAHYLVLGLAVVLTGGSCSAQSMNMQIVDAQTTNPWQPPPDTHPDTRMKLDLESANDHATVRTLPDFLPEAYTGTPSTGSSVLVSRPYTTSPRTADTKFFLLNGIHLGMAIFDVEMTQRCIANHRCHETNPFMPSSQAGQLGINFALVGSGSLASYWLKKHQSKLWWLPPATGTIAHSYGVATGFEHQ
jgi:hypothetical protein